MSRIYDALQRADRERKATQEADSTQAGEPFTVPDAEELPEIKADLLLEDVALHPWNLSLVSLPTIGDSGEIIEQFRALRSQLYKHLDAAPLKTILISSGIPAEGKTFVAANLAMSLARSRNNRVLLIDADLRGPALHSVLGAPRTPGITEYLAGTAELNRILQRNQIPRVFDRGLLRNIPELTFIPAGAGGDGAAELIASPRFDDLVTTLAPHFDWILIDTPPTLAFADAIDLARTADAVLLVARAASTPYEVAQRAQAAFSNSRILGFVLNAVRNATRTGYYYGYGYGKTAGGESHRRKDKRREE
ncbi:MAG: CpsD/CapB family tyrosine-protein kinase [Terracidiphilus sp.]